MTVIHLNTASVFLSIKVFVGFSFLPPFGASPRVTRDVALPVSHPVYETGLR